MRASHAVATAFACIALLAACGEETAGSADPESSQSPSETPAGPSCEEVWVAEKPFPADYAGCVADGVLVPADPQLCTTGQEMFTYDNRFYAASDGKVIETDEPLDSDPRYQAAYASCTA